MRFREIREVREVRIKKEEKEKEEDRNYLKIKPETDITVEEARAFLDQLFSVDKE